MLDSHDFLHPVRPEEFRIGTLLSDSGHVCSGMPNMY